MDVNVYLIVGAIIVVAIIVINHQRQKNTVQTMLNESSSTQSLFLMKAVEKKNKALADILYDGGVKPSALAASAITGPRGVLIKELENLERQYIAKKIPLRTYDEQLFDLLEKAKKLPVTA